LRFRTNSHAEPSNINAPGIAPGGKLTRGTAFVVMGAVVATVAVTVCGVLPLICTEELDRVQLGGEVTAGVTAQVRFTVSVNDPAGAKDKVNFALCPALTVWDVGEPDETPMAKSGAACTVKVSAAIREILPETPVAMKE